MAYWNCTIRPAAVGSALRPELAVGAVAVLCAVMALPNAALPSSNHLQTAIELINQGDLEGAEKEARLALNSPEERAPAWSVLGTIRVQQKKYDEGVEFLRRAITLNPRLVGARVTLGGVYVLQGKKDPAREAFTEAVRLDPSNFNAHFDLAQLESDSGNYRASLEAAKPIASALKRSPEGLVLLSTDYSELQQKDSLEALVPEWNALADSPPELAAAFATVLIKNGSGREAIEILEKARSTSPHSFDVALALGRGYASMNDLDQASESYEAALRLNDSCVHCLTEIARIADHQGNLEKALAYLIRAKAIEPEDPEILFEFGKVCLEKNLIDDALPALQKAVALKPDYDPYVYVMGSAYVARGDRTQAAEVYRQLLKKHPADPVLNYAMGAVLYLQGRHSEAESFLKKSVEGQPDQIAAYYYLALNYDSMGQQDRAVGLFRDLLKRHPDHASATADLGKILLRQHKYDEAQQVLERAVTLDPNSAQAHYQLAMVLHRLGKTAQSEEEFAASHKLEMERHARTDQRLRLLLPD
jgi:tetratricopeptide (TPR) repeat protein